MEKFKIELHFTYILLTYLNTIECKTGFIQHSSKRSKMKARILYITNNNTIKG